MLDSQLSDEKGVHATFFSKNEDSNDEFSFATPPCEVMDFWDLHYIVGFDQNYKICVGREVDTRIYICSGLSSPIWVFG